MNNKTVGLRIASAIFGLIALAQLMRLLTRVEVLVAGRPFPLWPNAVAFLVAGSLSIWLWWLSYRGTK
jgi:hypothetical protein